MEDVVVGSAAADVVAGVGVTATEVERADVVGTGGLMAVATVVVGTFAEVVRAVVGLAGGHCQHIVSQVLKHDNGRSDASTRYDTGVARALDIQLAFGVDMGHGRYFPILGTNNRWPTPMSKGRNSTAPSTGQNATFPKHLQTRQDVLTNRLRRSGSVVRGRSEDGGGDVDPLVQATNTCCTATVDSALLNDRFAQHFLLIFRDREAKRT